MAACGPLNGYLDTRTHLLATAEPGAAAARTLADLTDEAILRRARVASSALQVPFALFALGGYGARRLLPNSDIDLLVVSRGTKKDLGPLVREVLYPLWDAGLTVGHQVRTPKGQVAAVREDLTIATSFLTARFLVGDADLASRVTTDSFRRLRRSVRNVRAAILGRERPGSPYLLEPDLKDDAGGQRDIDELVWHAALLAGAPAADPAALAEAGLLTSAEREAINAAGACITAARWALHLTDSRSGNLLTLDEAGTGALDADAVQRALETVHHTLLAVRERLEGRPAEVPRDLTLADLRALSGGGSAALDAAERAAYAGRLDAAVPGFRALMTLRRPALSHRFTVGAHTLRVVQALGGELGTLGAGRVDDQMRDATLVAALAHDAGKREAAPGHATRGGAIAEAAALALGLSAAQGEAARTLVTEHLLLSDMVAHADLSDEDAVLAAAARLGDRRLVAPLYALSASDMRATGPEVWTAWSAAMVGDLAAKLENALSPDVDGAGIVKAAEGTRTEARRVAASMGSSRAVLTFLDHAPLRYLARRTSEEVLHDARLVRSIAGPGAPGRFAFSVRVGPAEGVWLVDVVTRDRPGLFATVSGALALVGLDALSAEAHTDHVGIALDTFAVTSATRAPVETTTWNAFERTLGLALTGTFDLDTRLAERRRHYPTRATSVVPTVEIETRTAFATTIRVRAADRVGLLHDLSRVIAERGLDIRRARITTLSGVASDAFEVTDAEGAPPEPDVLRDQVVPELEAAARA